MRLQVVSTGSQANCYLLEAGTEVLILDAGLPVRKMLPHIRDFRSVVGCLVTHEHGDHARGAVELARRGIPVYCSAGTMQALDGSARLTRFKPVRALQAVRVGEFTVMGFETQHDASEPLGFIVRYEATGETLLYATDTYYLRYTFPCIHYWIVECNYCDEVMNEALQSGKLDAGLRNRLLESHMSLRRLKDALAANDLSKAVKIVLVHLSDSRSDERRMVQEIESQTNVETVAAANGMSIPLELIPF